MSGLWESLQNLSPEWQRDLLLDEVPSLARKYGDIAATAAAEWYEQVRAQSVNGSYEALTADSFGDEAIQASIRYKAGSLFGDDPSVMADFLSGALQRWVMYSGRQTIAWNVKHDPTHPRYARVPTGVKTCAFCGMLSSRGFIYYTEASAGGDFHRYHAECVVPDTRVLGPAILAGLTRHYEGTLINLVTAKGRHLSVTPNHPILTSTGWIPAGDLQEGDDLLCCIETHGQEGSVPDVAKVPPTIEQVIRSLSFDASAVRLRVPASTKNLNPQIPDGHVDVMRTDGGFSLNDDSHIVEHCHHGQLASAWTLSTGSGFGLHGYCTKDARLPSIGNSELSGMGGSDLRRSFFGGHSGSSDDPSGGSISDLDVILSKPPSNDSSGHASTVCYGENTGAGDIGWFNPVGHRDSLSAGLNSIASEISEDGRLCNSTRLCNILRLGTGLIESDSLVFKGEISYSGHVYNLHTDGGWFTANSIITHNCDCQVVPEWDGRTSHITGYDPDALYAQYLRARDGLGDSPSTTAILANLRRLYPNDYTDGVKTTA